MTSRPLILLALLLLCGHLAAEVPYTVKLQGIEGELEETLYDASTLVTLRDRPPATLAALRRRANGDVETMLDALHSFGYYDATVEFGLRTQDGVHDIVLEVTPGPQYQFADPLLALPDDHPFPDDIVALFEAISLEGGCLGSGNPALAVHVIEGRDHILYGVGKRGFPLARLVDEQVLVDRYSKRVRVIYTVDPGPRALTGAIHVSGLEKVNESYILDMVTWCEGELYHPAPLSKLQHALQASPLFSFARVTAADELDEDGTIPILIEVMESKHRSIGLGLSYNTQRGAGVSGDWEHRNIWGRGESFSIRANLWQELQRGTAIYRIPNFICTNQSLVWLGELEKEETKVFKEKSLTISVALENEFSTCSSLSYGVAIKQLESSKSDNEGSFTLFKLPLYYTWDNSNDLLDPTRGTKLHLQLVPTQDLQDPDLFYARAMTTAIAYLPLDDECRYVIAGKIVAGTLSGASRLAIPAPERIYSGNEHTLRGYSFMTVSPLNAAGDPIGGRSILVSSIEWRQRLSDSWGWAAFYEAGNVYGPSTPQLDRRQLQSAGFGVRYFTAIGPLRLDVAFPLNRRPNLDSAVQVYFSIGQAF